VWCFVGEIQGRLTNTGGGLGGGDNGARDGGNLDNPEMEEIL